MAAFDSNFYYSRCFVLRVTVFLLVSSLLLSVAALLTYIRHDDLAGAYTATLSCIVTSVAAFHYHAILKVRINTNNEQTSEELEVDTLRHSDWFVTLPILVLKLHYVLNTNSDLFFENAELSAFMSMLMIFFGSIARLSLGSDHWNMRQMLDSQRLLVWLCYIVSVILLVVLLLDLGNTATNAEAPAIVWSFFLLWIGYPVVAIGSFLAQTETVPKNATLLSFSKDLAYALLDTWCKAVFAWWTASRCFDIHFLGV